MEQEQREGWEASQPGLGASRQLQRLTGKLVLSAEKAAKTILAAATGRKCPVPTLKKGGRVALAGTGSTGGGGTFLFPPPDSQSPSHGPGGSI